jgi:hypothetical protein
MKLKTVSVLIIQKIDSDAGSAYGAPAGVGKG